MSEVPVIGGGTIPKEDIPFLLEQGKVLCSALEPL